MKEIQAVKTAKIEEIKKNSKKGFTLVELVVVIAILAILAAIAIPVVSSTIASSQRSSALSNAQTLELALKEAQSQIVANDTSAGYTSATTVSEVISSKSLQSINYSVTISNTTYTLTWNHTDDKCYYVDTNGSNLDASITPGTDSAPYTFSTTDDASQTVIGLF